MVYIPTYKEVTHIFVCKVKDLIREAGPFNYEKALSIRRLMKEKYESSFSYASYIPYKDFVTLCLKGETIPYQYYDLLYS